MKERHVNVTTLQVKVLTNPLETLSSLAVQLCQFTEAMGEFYSKRPGELEEATAAIYTSAQLIFATFGAACTSNSPELLVEMARFCQSKSDAIIANFFTQQDEKEN